jgi:hypothetical protein
MNLDETIRLYAGGPGSGRHPEYGKFTHMSTNRTSGANYHDFKSKGGVRIGFHQNYSAKAGTVYENGQKMHEGTVGSAEGFLKDRYGIES